MPNSINDDFLPNDNTYVIDAESATEMTRLLHQDRIVTQSMQGLFPERSDVSDLHDVLDIACGPGGWTLDVAHLYPKMKVVGIDISRTMIQYARAQARVQLLKNVTFQVMDASKLLEFPDNSFDLVNARTIMGFLSKKAWPQFLQECMRITRPGGIIRLTESETTITTSPAAEQIGGLGTLAFFRAGLSFSPDGRQVCITPVLGRLLHEAGYSNIQRRPHVMDFSTGAAGHEAMYQNYMVALKLMQRFLVKMGVTTDEEFEPLYQQMLVEMKEENFCGLWYLLTAWGTKPQ